MLDGYSKEDILKIIEEEDIEFVYLQFTDIFGVLKNVAIPSEGIKKALDNEVTFDGSSIDGYVRVEEADMYLKPDLNTFCIYPWQGRSGKEARFICDVYNPDGTPFEGDPRNILKRACSIAGKNGYTMQVSPECEFFLFHTDEKGKPTLVTHDDAGYFDLAPIDLGENARRDMVMMLKNMGFEIEASHHEVASGQHEIDLASSEALKTADNIMTFKSIVKIVAKNHGLHATFMPKPIYSLPGSGMHINQSLFYNDKNAFYNENDKRSLSDTAYSYLAGIIKHARAMCAITNPTVNSYKRLVSGFEAPIYIAWSSKNQSPLIRVPTKRGINTRIELRNPDPSCNPYLALAVILSSGLDGIENNIKPPKPVEMNIFELPEDKIQQENIQILPQTLEEAINCLQEDEIVKDALGGHILSRFIEAKQNEWEDYRNRVTDWEIEKYLTKF